jgi:uncharacterized protein (TIGR02099 family)
LHSLKKTLRALFLCALIAYFAMAATMLAVRYLVLPHVNAWRPQIEQRLSASFGSPVTVGDVNANWSGLNPTLSILNLSIRTPQGDTLLNIPKTDAIVSWRSLLALDLRLKHLDVNGIDITVEKQADGKLAIAGYVLDAMPDTDFKLDSDTLASRWLLGQGEIVVHDATLRWRDLERGTPELKLTSVDFALSNGLLCHQLLVRGSAPESLAQGFELIVRADHLLGPLGKSVGRHAEIYVELQDLAPAALLPWIDLPEISGRFAGRAWIDVQQGKLATTTIEIVGSKVGASLSSSKTTDSHETATAVFAQSARFRVAGQLGDMLPMKSDLLAVSTGPAAAVDIQASAEGATLDSALFQPSLVVAQKAELKMKLNHLHDQISAHINALTLSNSHLHLTLQGDWSAAGASAAGVANMTGTIVKLSAPELHRYLTVNTSESVRQWLRSSLLQGEFRQAALTLQGDLSEFPFNQPQAKGIFKIDGQYQNLLMDYSPAKGDVKGWPALAHTNGSILIHQLGLNMHSDTGSLLGARGERIQLTNLDVNIPDMGINPLLSLDMQLSAEAGLFVNVMRETPLNEKLGGMFNQLGATGSWGVPLSIRADLNDMDKLQAKGRIVFSGGNLAWGDALPELESIQGSLIFTNGLIETDKFQAKFLGEPLTIQGSFGQPSSTQPISQPGTQPIARGITIEGVLPIAALSKLTQSPALSVFEGRTRYRAQVIQNNKDGVDVSVSSALDGLSIALPAPIGKTKETSAPFNLKWSSTKQRKDYRQSVSFNLGDIINGKLERLPDPRSKTFFTQAAIAMGGASVLPAAGMNIDVSLGEVDWADWKGLSEKLSSEKVASAKRTTNLLPQVQSVSIRTPRLIVDDLTFTDLNLTTTQAEKGQWSARLDSKETAGSVEWKESSGAVAGRVVAKFTKLALGAAPTDDEEAPKIQSIDENQWSDIPAVDLTIDDFTLFGSRLGSLRLTGENTERGSIWNIDHLEIKNPHATLSANGLWRLKGDSRGIKLKSELAIADLGKLSGFMGYPDKVKAGSGTIQADIDWLNFPWAFSYEGMAGTADIEMKEGIFVHVNSRSARLLELLSLQSLQRILSFNFRPSNEFQNGFPWESISGKFVIAQGVAKTENLTISSPVASILLAGDSDLSRKTWNMSADVKPRFDMSGSAVATGFLVNPLVGVSALVTQYLLRNPIERAMTAKYHVRGPWDDPTLIPIDMPAPRQQGMTTDPGN